VERCDHSDIGVRHCAIRHIRRPLRKRKLTNQSLRAITFSVFFSVLFLSFFTLQTRQLCYVRLEDRFAIDEHMRRSKTDIVLKSHCANIDVRRLFPHVSGSLIELLHMLNKIRTYQRPIESKYHVMRVDLWTKTIAAVYSFLVRTITIN
jgi:hypothetical protein